MRLLCALLALISPLAAATFYVTVAGIGGEPDYEQRFALLAAETEKTIKAHSPDASVQTLSGANATRANLKAALEKVEKASTAQDTFVLLLIGHGTFDRDYKMNLPGPDITAAELATMMNRIPTARQLVVNTTSASGAGNEALKHANRVVISATKSGSEKNATVFARYWVEALNDPTADTDKNGVISATEAFKFAERKTKAFYEEQKRLSTEHAVLDDPAKANTFAVVRLNAEAVSADPAKRALQAKRDQIEGQIDQLKYQKSLLAPDSYRAQLSKLLLELARTQEELDK